MKNLMTAMSFVGACFVTLTLVGTGHAQTIDPKQEWAAKVVTLQQGPELDRLVEQLAASTTQDLLQNWVPKVDALPAAKQRQVKDALNLELQKYSDDVAKAIGGKVAMVSNDALVPAYKERFTLEELKQIAAFFESPAIKKYQAAAPELGNVFVQKLVEATRADVTTRAGQFNEAATKIVGIAPATRGTPAPSSAPGNKTKPPVPAARQ